MNPLLAWLRRMGNAGAVANAAALGSQRQREADAVLALTARVALPMVATTVAAIDPAA